MPIVLTELTTDELAQLVAVFDLLDPLLVLLEEKQIVSGEDGIDLNELYVAVFEEDEARAVENAEFDTEQAIALGHMMKVTRPDGEIGYVLTDAGMKHLQGLS